MRTSQGLGRRLGRILRYYYLRLVRIDDSPEKIAGGVAFGVFLGIFPTFGLGLILAVALAHRLHVNRAAALLGSVIMNPLTSPLFWGLCAWVGAGLFGVDEREIRQVIEAIEPAVKGWLAQALGIGAAEPTTVPDLAWGRLAGRLGLAYLVGTIVVSAAFAAVSYLITVRVAAAVHARRLERRHRRAARRAARAEAAEGPAGSPERADVRPHG